MVPPELIAELIRVVGPRAVVLHPDALRTYDADASMIVAHAPDVAVLPATPEEAAAVVRLAVAAGLPVVARGAGTGIAGGAIPVRGGVLLSTARMERIEAIEPRSRRALVGAGVVNAELNARLAPLGLQFAPDPSSQKASTIGGNLATNAGGPHCLKYGVTTNHVLALELARPDGTLLWTGDGTPDAAGYDLTGVVVGSEGTFGVITRALVRLTPLPEANRVVLALFPNVVAASAAVSRIIAAGALPASLEVMDHNGIRAVNRAYGLGLPESGETTLLIIEVDGVNEGLDETLEEILEICRAQGAFDLRPARTPAEQARVWAARKAMAGAVGRLAPAYLLVDTVVPRTRLPLMMEHIERLRHEWRMEVCNVFHAGDGNLHPMVLYDPRDADQRARAHAIAGAVLKLSIEQGGVISGEHGIGVEKQEYLPLLLEPHELQLHAAIYTCFNPEDCFNPGKIFPAALRPRDLAAQRQARMRATAPRSLPGAGGEGEGRSRLAVTGAPEASRLDSAALAAIVGADYVTASGAALAVSPGSVEELARVVALCHRVGAPVRPCGDAARLDGARAQTPALRIATRRLKRVLVYEPDDLTIGVEAGMSLAELQTLLAANGQMLPLDVHRPEAATLGALVAVAADGPRRLGYGTLRDWVLGLTIVEADGAVSRLGGQVVKNVSGFDLVKLLVGSHGTLGVIAAVRLRVFPRPRAAATLLAAFAGRQQALACLDAVADTRLQPTAAELVAGPPEPSAPLAVPSGGALLALRAEGHPAAVARHMRALRALAGEAGALSADELSGGDEEALWAEVARRAAPPEAPGASLMRLCAAPAGLGAALDAAEAEALPRGLALSICARGLSGVAYLQVAGPVEGRLDFHAALVRRLRHAHLLDPFLAARAAQPRGAPPPALGLMRAIKTELDPFNRMNPGAFFWRDAASAP
ncbi:MAG: FAD-linked oxidase C-terminal domain-containing protein [Oscillochloridaceae bacterium]|nr:FAD-binding oxidoreductase [Chloroflexaceae bacterium]MDW8390563.1 FAD-linked oxidase C-terminal domain-containing protein [Oscillochloridaceae bacterium]